MGIKIVVGSGEYNNNPGWLHTNEEELNLLDEKTWQDKFEEQSLSAIIAEHVWEHLTFDEGIIAAKICYKFLAKNGYVRCAVPDGYFPDDVYQNLVKVDGPGPAATHKIVHNYKTLTKMFESAGFKVNLLEYCNENGYFCINEWDGNDGIIFRSKKYDPRNQGEKLIFPSLIVDAVKIEL
ncbi:MAG: protein distantly related to SAM-dependent methyltransferase [Bacillales bacterium]|jgi:predicted SAM-dependent methyltransferase|nr:protein distantly related to SAM-dependent methyltransferase [Bacillales bacterium]